MDQKTWEDTLFKSEEERLERFLRLERDEERRLLDPDGWNSSFDSTFAEDFFEALPAGTLRTQHTPTQCCNCCSSILAASCDTNLSDVRAAEKDCQFCALLLRTLVPHVINDDGRDVRIVRKGSALKVGSNGQHILWVSSNLGSVDTKTHIQTERLVHPGATSSARFELLRTWLRWCDQHPHCNIRHSRSNQLLPSRLLWVGDPDDQHYDPNLLRLSTTTDKSGGKYVALSHCWGKLPTEVKKHFCTTSDNISRREGGFSFWELPKTFQDAVKVTRELHIPYIWIDSLCIVQYGDNGEDWKREACRMEKVFSGAYCTIAATSASNSYTGFLQPHMKHDYIHVQDPSGNRFYICAGRDDFDNDVEKALLNTRAWVMQERVLSRRTIHFSANQVYWECGEGVYCENLTRLESSFRKKYFMLDPGFPGRLLASGDQRTMEFIRFLSQDYSKRGLTEKTDRCAAISGLEARIARALGCKSRYGIFERYLHRNLLWQPSDIKMEKIVYRSRQVPSWSWMVYDGGIQFFDEDTQFGDVDWIANLRFHDECEHALIADLGKFQDGMELDGNSAVLDSGGMERGRAQYDVEKDKDEERRGLCEERCVVVGRKTKNGVRVYYILVVRPTRDGEYRRVGVGLIQSDCVVRERLSVRVV